MAFALSEYALELLTFRSEVYFEVRIEVYCKVYWGLYKIVLPENGIGVQQQEVVVRTIVSAQALCGPHAILVLFLAISVFSTVGAA